MTTNKNDNNVTMSEVDENTLTKPATSQSLIGKRIRKKNPKYSDSDKNQDFTLPTKNGRPKKKRKLNNGNAQINNLYEKKKDLETQMFEIKKEIEDVNQKLAIKKAEITKDEQFNAPTDDEDDTLITKSNVNYTPTSRGRKSTRGRRKKRGSNNKKATTPRKPNTPRKPTTPKVTPKKVTKPRVVDPILLPEYTFCRNILDTLMKHRYGFPFNVPVDPVLLKIPDYFLVIKNPMDFGTIRDKLNTQKYNSPCEFIDDVNLVFNNACTYNSPSSDVYIMAETLRKLFKKKIVSFEKKLAEINPSTFKELRKSVDSIGDSFNDVPSDTKESLSHLNPELKPLTKEEKKRLRGHINSLSRYNLAILLNIVQEKISNESAVDSSTQKEVIIDLDSLDTATLRALQKFVQSTLKKKNNKTKTVVRDDNKDVDTGTNDSKSDLGKDKKDNTESEESESDSESESESDESDSDDIINDSKEENYSNKEPNVDTDTRENIPKIISATTLINTKEVNVEKLENAASWSDIANQKEESETVTHSPGVANLWSSFRDSHAQVQQKELEKKMHEELLKKEKEKEEEERKRKEEELKQKLIEEEKEKVRKQEEEKLRLEMELEEARLKAKRDREKKVQQDEELVENTDDLLNSFSTTGSIALNMNLSGQLMSDIRSSLKMSSTSIERTTTEEDNKNTE